LIAVDKKLVLLATLMPQPVVDRVRRDGGGQRSEILRRRGGDTGELLEAPVREGGRATRRAAKGECVGCDGFGPECDGLDSAFFGAEATYARRIVERLNAGVPFIWWARCPFPVSRVRGDGSV
jgi:hypothetical protein